MYLVAPKRKQICLRPTMHPASQFVVQREAEHLLQIPLLRLEQLPHFVVGERGELGVDVQDQILDGPGDVARRLRVRSCGG